MLSVGRNRKRQRNLIFPHFHTHSHATLSNTQRTHNSCENTPSQEQTLTQSTESLSNLAQSLCLTEPTVSNTASNMTKQLHNDTSVTTPQANDASDTDSEQDHEEQKSREPHESKTGSSSLPTISSSAVSNNQGPSNNGTNTSSSNPNTANSTTSTSCFFKVTKIQPLHLFLPKLTYSLTHHLSSSSSLHAKSSSSASLSKLATANASTVPKAVKKVTFTVESKTWDGPRESLVSFDELLFCFLVKGKAIGDGDVLKWTKRSASKINALALLLLDLLHRITLVSATTPTPTSEIQTSAESCENEAAANENSESEGCEESVPCLPHGGGHALRVERSYKPYLVTLLSVLITALKHAQKQSKDTKEKETNSKRRCCACANELGLCESEVERYLKEVDICLDDVSKVNNLTFQNFDTQTDSRLEQQQS